MTTDLLKPVRRPELGPVLHRENYDAARAKLDAALTDLHRGFDTEDASGAAATDPPAV